MHNLNGFTVSIKFPSPANVPNQEKQTISGWKWLRVEWNPSRQLLDVIFKSYTSQQLVQFTVCSSSLQEKKEQINL